MQGMKLIVAVLSTLIVIGLGLLVYGIYKKSNSPQNQPPQDRLQALQAEAAAEIAREKSIPPTVLINGSEVAAAPPPNGTKNITLPARSQVRQVIPYKNGVALHVKTGKGEYIYFVNNIEGKMDGMLRIDYAPFNAPQRRTDPPQRR